MRRMDTIKPGMTRADLDQVFTTEGGLSSRAARTFVSRDCPYFKVDVVFELVGPPDLPATDCRSAITGAPCPDDVKARIGVSPRDTIISISRPYLQFTIYD